MSRWTIEELVSSRLEAYKKAVRLGWGEVAKDLLKPKLIGNLMIKINEPTKV